MVKEKEETEGEQPTSEQPDFGKIILATVVGVLILAGITYAGYRYSQQKITGDVVAGCENCIAGTQILFDGWDQNENGIIDDCSEACMAYWGSSCEGNSYCGNPGSADPGNCCVCVTSTGDFCSALPLPTPAVTDTSPTPDLETTTPTP